MQNLLKSLTPCLAIIVLGGLEMFALSKGIDGELFAGIAAIIGGLAGYKIKSAIKQ